MTERVSRITLVLIVMIETIEGVKECGQNRPRYQGISRRVRGFRQPRELFRLRRGRCGLREADNGRPQCSDWRRETPVRSVPLGRPSGFHLLPGLIALVWSDPAPQAQETSGNEAGCKRREAECSPPYFGRLSTTRFALPSERSMPPGAQHLHGRGDADQGLDRDARGAVPAASPSAAPAAGARSTSTVISSRLPGRVISIW